MSFLQKLEAGWNRLRGKKEAVQPSGYLGPQYSDDEVARIEARLAQWENQDDLTKYVKKCFQAAKTHREELDRDAVTGFLFEAGRQWSAFDDKTREVYSIISTDNEAEKYVTDNLIGMLVQKFCAIVTSGRPDLTPVAMADSELHKAAAREAAAIFAAEDVRQGRREQQLEWCRWAATVGTGWILPRWDSGAEVEVAELGEGGAVTGRKMARLGAPCEDVVPGLEVFTDPAARRVWDASYMIHATTRAAGWVRSVVGKEKMTELDMKPDARSAGVLSPLYLSYSQENPSVGSDGGAVYGVIDFWAKPGDMFPDGLRAVLIGGVLVHAGPWPYAKRDAYPFIPLRWRRVLGSPYGRSMAAELAPLQMAYNRTITDVLNYLENAVPTVLTENGNELRPGEFGVKQNKKFRVVSFTGESGARAPQWMDAPSVPGDVYRLREWALADMQDLAGIHDVSLGKSGANQSGVAINLLQESDRTQHAPFLAELEEGMRDLREWEVSLYSQFATPYVPRLIGLDETGNALEDGKYGALALRAITGGGSVSVHLVPGSSIGTTPEAKKQEALSKYTGGLLGAAGSPESRIRLAELMNDGSSDKLKQWAQEDAQKQDAIIAMQGRIKELESALLEGGGGGLDDTGEAGGLDEIGSDLEEMPEGLDLERL
jgi:hypothetical protein